MSNSVHCTGPAREIVLASASPRRRDILQTLGLSFVVDSADVDETVKHGARIDDVVRELALAKARDVAFRHQDSLIVAGDTLVELEGQILGKPSGPEDARRMLSFMSGHQHRVVTGLALLDPATGNAATSSVETLVTFRPMTESEIEAYVATGEPLDKAGSYGIQGLGAAFVDRIDGDYYNVAGLPVAALNALLEEAGCCIICRSLRNESE
jgi:septum formation protein